MNLQSGSEANRQAAWRWGGFVVGLLTLQVGIGAGAIILATSDDSADVIPNYYQKALDWDDEVALQQASAALGWKLKLDVKIRRGEAAGLVLQLTDQDGTPVNIASGRLQWYRDARAAEVHSATIPTLPGGMFTMDACFDTGGLWQVTVEVTDVAGNRFVDSRVLDLAVPTSSADTGTT